jgi:hypothetical protein
MRGKSSTCRDALSKKKGVLDPLLEEFDVRQVKDLPRIGVPEAFGK